MSIALSSVSAFTAAIAHARSIDVAAYTMRSGSVLDTLVAAAQGGTGVRVRLERDPIDTSAGFLHQANIAAVARLRAAGADAALRGPDEPVLHLKAALVDGEAWLDDRNWSGDRHETVLRDSDAGDCAAVAAALAGSAGPEARLRTSKAGAQALEVELIRAAGVSPLAVESESFGSGDVYNALLARGQASQPTRLLVAGREALAPTAAGETERRRLAKLAQLGIEVRTGRRHGADLDEKLAVSADVAWVGSANATYARDAAGRQRDWGLATRMPALVDGLRAAFETNWHAGRALTGATLREATCANSSAITSTLPPPVPSCAPRSTSAWTSR